MVFRFARSSVRVSVRFKDDVAIVSLNGKFVAGSDGPYLRQKVKDLVEAGAGKLLFQFDDVPYIDSTGLGFLAGSRELAAEAGATIVLTGINPHVRRILDGVKLTQFFELAQDEVEGLARLASIEQKKLAVSASTAAPGTEAAPDASKPTRTKKRPVVAEDLNGDEKEGTAAGALADVVEVAGSVSACWAKANIGTTSNTPAISAIRAGQLKIKNCDGFFDKDDSSNRTITGNLRRSRLTVSLQIIY